MAGYRLPSGDCRLAARRGHRLLLEGAVFHTVLHRLMRGSSDLAAGRSREQYRIGGCNELDLHHLYRAMTCNSVE
jgi:hypothetical protein